MLLIYPLTERNQIINKALKSNSKSILRRYVRGLVKRGVDCFDLCFSREKSLFFILQALEATEVPLSIDTHNRRLLSKILKKHPFFLINSSYPDKESLKFYFKLARQANASLVILSMYQREVRLGLDKRKALIDDIVKLSEKNKFPLTKIFLDVVVLPFKFYPEYIYFPLILSSYVKNKFPLIKTLAGLDNITYKGPNLLLKKAYYFLLSPTIDVLITREFFL